MKNGLLKVLFGLVFVLAIAGIAHAGDMHSFAVTCTIPEIPGVNAPMIQETSTRSEQKISAAQENTPKVESGEKNASKENQMLMAEQTNEAETVQTVYSR